MSFRPLTREKQRFANYLFLKCFGMAQDKEIRNISVTTIALMERFETVDDLANADPAAKAKAILATGGDSYRLPITVNHSVNQAVAVSIDSMRALEKQVKVLGKAIT